MKFRILLRTAKFIAFYWTLPFLLGCTLAIVLITTGEYLMVDRLIDAFEGVLATCAK